MTETRPQYRAGDNAAIADNSDKGPSVFTMAMLLSAVDILRRNPAPDPLIVPVFASIRKDTQAVKQSTRKENRE